MSRRTTILLDPDLLERVERLARVERTTKTAVITAALEAHLRTHEQRPDLPFVAVGRSDHGRLSVDSRAIARRQAGRAPLRG
jgi:predicted transcriptional regulator